MPKTIVLLYVPALACWLGAGLAYGQPPAAAQPAIEVQGAAAFAETCLSAATVRARVAHYRAPNAPGRDLRFVLRFTGRDALELQVVQGAEVIARRKFAPLPAACDERRDAVALSIALALERSDLRPAAERGAAPKPGPTRRARASAPSVSAAQASAEATQPADAMPAPVARALGLDAAGTHSAEPPRDHVDSADTAARAPDTPADARVQAAAASERPPNPDPALRQPAATAGARGDAREPRSLEPAATPDSPAGARVQDAAAPEQPPEPEGPVVLGTLPSTTSHDPRRAAASSLQLHLGARLSVEVVPATVWAGALGLELPLSSSPRWTLDLSALVSSVGESALAGARARASFYGLEAVGCSDVRLGLFMFQACGGAAVALCQASGSGYPVARPDATLLWAAVVGRASLRWPRTTNVALRGLVQPHFSIERPELHVAGSSERLRSAWLGVTTGLELWLALP